MADNTWSVFLSERKVSSELGWGGEYFFYKGDLSKVVTKDDWRFGEVTDIRKEAVFLGVVTTGFPVKYPLQRIDSDGVIVDCAI